MIVEVRDSIATGSTRLMMKPSFKRMFKRILMSTIT